MADDQFIANTRYLIEAVVENSSNYGTSHTDWDSVQDVIDVYCVSIDDLYEIPREPGQYGRAILAALINGAPDDTINGAMESWAEINRYS